MNEQRKNLLVFSFAFLLLLVMVGLVMFLNKPNTIDNAPIEGESPNSAKRVNLVNGEMLLAYLQNTQALDRFSSEMFLFGKTAYNAYEKEEQPMGFQINSVSKKDDQILVDGRFGLSKNLISSSIVKLNDGHISISIVDRVTGLNIDKFLPSNQPKNQLIGRLPLDESGYSIRYLKDKDTFVVSVFNTESNYAVAEQLIRESLGDELFSQQTVVKYGAGDVQYDNGF